MAHQRASAAFQAMKALGISPKTVKPVLKNLLQLYDNNWALIEEENYRVLADAIFDLEDTMEEEAKMQNSENVGKVEDKQKELRTNDESMPPRTRQRSRQEDGPSACNPGIVIHEPLSKRPKSDGAVPPLITQSQQETGQVSSETHLGEKRAEPVPAPADVKGKRPEVVSSQTNAGEKAGPVSVHLAIRDKTGTLSPQKTGPVSLHLAMRDKTGTLSPQIGSKENRLVHEGASNTNQLKEPKIEPGVGLLPKGHGLTSQSFNALIKPKDEPFTSDFPQFEEPIAVIHPLPSTTRNEDQVRKDGSSGNNSSGQSDVTEASASLHLDARAERENDIQETASQSRASLELVSLPEASSANVEIASSPAGEVKLSLTCNSAFARSDFHMPNLDEVLKLVEDKCLRSYKILEPTFSVVKLMQDICQSFLELGTSSSADDKEEYHVNVTPTLDFLKKSDIQNVLGSKCNPLLGNFNDSVSSSNGSPDTHSPIVTDPQVSRLLGLNGMDGFCHHMQPNQGVVKHSNNGKDTENMVESSESPQPNSHSLMVVPQQFSFDDARPLHDVNDIAKGEERVRISLVNEVNSEPYPPSFYYMPWNIIYQNAYVNFSLARIGDEDCCSDCFGDCLLSSIPCACARETGGEYAYTLDGLVKEEFLDECISMDQDPQKHRHFYCIECPLQRSKNEAQPNKCKGHLMRKFIKECWSKCGCNKRCGNRVVQRGIRCNLQVFFTSEGKGWGLRTLEELPRGTFVCEYVGEILTNTESYNRNLQNTGKEKHHYPVLLDADWGAEGALKDEETLYLDSTFYGNVSRFINHRCFDANLVQIPIEVETPDHHYYHIAFFTKRKVEALNELTLDYGIDFDDNDVKAFRCRCGSEFCRDRKRPTRGKSSALVLI